jgi:regulator of nucleoside diphosphate kinase
MRATDVLMVDSDRKRLQQYLAAWAARLARDEEHVERLRRRLESASVAPVGRVPATLVTLRSVIRVRDVDSDRAFVWTVVLPPAEEVATTARSPLSWAGAALLGAHEGDEVQWPSRSGSVRVRVEAVLFQPEAARLAASVKSLAEGKDMDRAPCGVRGGRRAVPARKRRSFRRVANERESIQERNR